MPRLVHATKKVVTSTSGLQLEVEGGTSASTALDAAHNLGAIPLAEIDVPYGYAGLHSGSLLKPEAVMPLPTLVGPTITSTGQTITYTITNYDNRAKYVLSANGGSVSMLNATITYTAPAYTGLFGFTINGREVPIVVGSIFVKEPAITNPVNDANGVSPTGTFSGSTFTCHGDVDTHVSSDWQIATDKDFGTLAFQSMADTVNLTSWTPGGLGYGTEYYIRVRHRGSTYGYSNWSNTLHFTTRSSTVIQWGEQAAFMPSDLTATTEFGELLDISTDGAQLLIADPQATMGSLYTAGGCLQAYRRDTSGNWTKTGTLTEGTPMNYRYFGAKVALSGDGNTAWGTSLSGSLVIFKRSSTLGTWSLSTTFTPPSTAYSHSVDLPTDGSMGVYGNAEASSSRGAVYVLSQSGSTVTTNHVLLASDVAVNDLFGAEVVVSNDRAVIAVLATRPIDNYRGKIYLFRGTLAGGYTQEAILQGAAGITSGDGVYYKPVKFNTGATKLFCTGPGNETALVYTYNNSTWQAGVIKNPDATLYSGFGKAIAVSDSGTILLATVTVIATGLEAVLHMTLTASAWTVQKVVTVDSDNTVKLLPSLSGSGFTAAIRNTAYTTANNLSNGRVHIFV